MLEKYADLPPEQEEIVSLVIGCAIAVHRELGPGFKESIYHQAFRLELDSRSIAFESEKAILVKYRQWSIPGQKIDFDCARSRFGGTESSPQATAVSHVSGAVIPSNDTAANRFAHEFQRAAAERWVKARHAATRAGRPREARLK